MQRDLRYTITGQDRSKGAIRSVKKGVSSLKREFAGLLGITSVGLLSRKAASDFLEFNSSLTKMVTLVGISREQVSQWRGELLNLSQVVGRGPTELAEGMFFVTSAGLRGASALETLTAAAKGSAIGLGETKTIADAATSAMNAYRSSNLSGAKSVAILAATVREGKAEADSIAGAMGTVIPIASKLGVSFDEVGAAIASMTKLGTNANEATTQLNAILLTTFQGGDKAEKALSKVGLSLSALRKVLREDGLLNMLLLLEKRFGGNDKAMTEVFGNVRALRGVFNLLGDNIESTRATFKSLAETTGGDLNKAMKELEELDPAFKLNQSFAKFDVTLNKMAERTMPGLIDVFAEFADEIPGVFDRIAVEIEFTRKALEQLAKGELSEAASLFAEGQNRSFFLGQDTPSDLPGEFSGNRATGLPAPINQSGGGSTSPVIPPAKIIGGASNDKFDKLKANLLFEHEQLGRNAEQQIVYNNAKRAGVNVDSKLGREIEMLTLRNIRLQESQDAVNDRMQFFGGIAADAFSSLLSGAESFDDVMKRVAGSIAEAALQAALLGQGPLASLFGTSGSGGGLGGLFGSFLGSGAGGASANSAIRFATTVRPPGFATGGSFEVGGHGGTDSKRIDFMATPGEIINISRPGQSSNGSKQPTIISSPTFTSGITGTDRAWFERRLLENNAQVINKVRELITAGRASDPNFGLG